MPKSNVITRIGRFLVRKVGRFFVAERGSQMEAYRSMDALTRAITRMEQADKRKGKGRKASKGSARGKGTTRKLTDKGGTIGRGMRKPKGAAKPKAAPKAASAARTKRFRLPEGAKLLAIVHSETQAGVKYRIIRPAQGGKPYCTCRAWAQQSVPLAKRTCKHLKAAGY